MTPEPESIQWANRTLQVVEAHCILGEVLGNLGGD